MLHRFSKSPLVVNTFYDQWPPFDCIARAARQIVKGDGIVSAQRKLLAGMASNVTGAARNQNRALHTDATALRAAPRLNMRLTRAEDAAFRSPRVKVASK